MPVYFSEGQEEWNPWWQKQGEQLLGLEIALLRIGSTRASILLGLRGSVVISATLSNAVSY